MEKGKLPFRTSDFEALRLDGQIYIDKTDFIFDLASERGKIFLSRPRRFGKSLLVSTFETLFRDGLKYFDGLKIAEKWKDKTYDVVKLDFSAIKENESIEEMRGEFYELLQNAFEKVGFCYNDGSNKSCIGQIDAWLSRQPPSSLVLLVDEYDAPLNSHLDNSEFFNQIRNMLSGFFLRVKSADRAWRFVFITGIAKFNKASIFSAFNNMKDISLDPAYGTLLGYTEDEILENFKAFVKHAAHVNGMEESALIKAMREKYDGFCFDKKASTHVYAPWSVLSFLDSPESGLENFWYDSAGNPSILRNYLTKHPFEGGIEKFDEGFYVSLDDLKQTNDVETLAPELFFFQTGYLSIKKLGLNGVYLNFPNGEVAHAMGQVMAAQLLRSKKADLVSLDKWEIAVKSGDVDALIHAMNGTFNQIDYLGYPLTQESHVRAAVQIYLLALNYGVTVENHYCGGRSDLEFDAGNFHWVLEFKYLHNNKNEDPDALLNEALRQIEEKRYGEGLNIGNRKLLRVGIVFDGDGQTKQFVRYGIIE